MEKSNILDELEKVILKQAGIFSQTDIVRKFLILFEARRESVYVYLHIKICELLKSGTIEYIGVSDDNKRLRKLYRVCG